MMSCRVCCSKSDTFKIKSPNHHLTASKSNSSIELDLNLKSNLSSKSNRFWSCRNHHVDAFCGFIMLVIIHGKSFHSSSFIHTWFHHSSKNLQEQVLSKLTSSADCVCAAVIKELWFGEDYNQLCPVNRVFWIASFTLEINWVDWSNRIFTRWSCTLLSPSKPSPRPQIIRLPSR